ncbi:MAG: hypothetical protein NZ853_08100 [Leptospiraceae bacterium]|nr:hypothetical protein [Leptospiraceae bacterium]MDW7976865.1 hypothetical protein [Leptospiraceae bacterium]
MKHKQVLAFLVFVFSLHGQEIEKLFEEEIKKTSPQKETQKETFTGSPTQFQFQVFNRSWTLDLMAAIDSVYEWDNNKVRTTDRKYIIRTGEFGFYSAIDQLAFGTLTFAAHYEEGKLFPEVHEAFFLFPATIIPRVNIRLGRMFPDVGRLNGIHQHDWPFTTPPVVHKELLDYEGILDTGLELSYLFPWSFWQELSLGVYNGRVFGHAHSEGELKQNPLYTLHLKHFFPLSNYWGTEFGFSFLRWHPTELPNEWNQQVGFDFYLKYKKGRYKTFFLQSEFWYRENLIRQKERWRYFVKEDFTLKEPTDFFGDTFDFNPPEKIDIKSRNFGVYHFLEYQFLDGWFIGYRYDYYFIPSLEQVNPYKRTREYKKNGTEENSLVLTYKPSEFSYFRIQATNTGDFGNGQKTRQYYFQAVFIIGMHPAHKY